MVEIRKVVDPQLVKKSAREYDMIVYNFLERNKDSLCDIYKLPSYNPTELKKMYLNWMKKNGHPKVCEPIHNRPWHITTFLSGVRL